MRPEKFLRLAAITLIIFVSLFTFTPVKANSDIPDINDLPVTGSPETQVVDTLASIVDASVRADEIRTQQEIEEFHNFVTSVINGNSSQVVGIFVNDVLSLPIDQQPSSNAGYITTQENLATQFRLAAQYGSIGILAHNFLAGENFFELSEGMIVTIVYGDGSTDDYLINSIQEYQALSPYSPYSEFIDLETNQKLTATELFYHVYANENIVVLQTCIEAEGIDSWGRLFVSATLIS